MFEDLTLTDPIATIVGALIAVVSGVVSGIVGSIWQMRKERQRWQLERELENRKTKIDLIGKANKILAKGFHEAFWLTWHARYIPEMVNEKSLDEYDAKMKLLYPGITAVLSQLAYAGEKHLFEFEEQRNVLWDIDRNIAYSVRRHITSDRDKAIGNLAELNDSVIRTAFESFIAFASGRPAPAS